MSAHITPQSVSAPSMTLRETAYRLSARLTVQSAAEQAWHGVSTDTRSVAAGELFVALRGENFDAHDFINMAAERGATAAMVSRQVDVSIPQIVVGDTMWGYGQLAQYWRSRFTVPTVAITGSNGKTTVKEMLRSIMVAHTGDANAVLATEGNLNNNIGVPRMLFRLNAAHRIAVLEMGMNHLHEIDYLSRLAVPDAALIIMAGTAHIGELGSREAIAQAKGEIYAGLREDGIACVNMDDRFADYWLALIGNHNRRRIVTFGTHPRAVVRGELVANGLRLRIAGASEEVHLQVAGPHNQRNAIAAAAGAFALNIPLPTIAAGLRAFAGVAGRLRSFPGHKGATIIDDTYNANPDSMRAAIEVLAAMPSKKVLVLGDMGELGSDAPEMHAEIGSEAKRAGIDVLLATGELGKEYVRAFGVGATHVPDIDALNALALAQLNSQTTMLVKGSRFMRMERVVAAMVEPSVAQHAKGH